MLQFILTLLLSSTLTFSRPQWGIGALYSITNDSRGSSIIINAIGSDGKVSYAGAVPTGGTGSYAFDILGPNLPDALISQGPVTVAGDRLFVVNAGSNTVSVFSINPTDPLKIRMVGKPVSSGGEFPVSVAVSPKTGDGRVHFSLSLSFTNTCVVDPKYGMKPHGIFYNFGLNLTTPPIGPPGTVSHVLFSEDGTKLRASVKGIASETPGAPPLVEPFVATWDVAHNGSLSPTFTKTIPGSGEGLRPFGMSNIPNAPNALFVTDPVLGVTIYEFTKPNVTFKPLTIRGETAICWVAYSKKTDSYWTTDVGANKIYEISVDSKTLNPTLKSTIPLPATESPIDNVVASVRGNDYLYVLSPVASSFNVFSLKKGATKLIQTFDFGKEAKGVNITPINTVGAAVYLI